MTAATATEPDLTAAAATCTPAGDIQLLASTATQLLAPAAAPDPTDPANPVPAAAATAAAAETEAQQAPAPAHSVGISCHGYQGVLFLDPDCVSDLEAVRAEAVRAEAAAGGAVQGGSYAPTRGASKLQW
jgi:hypothetical protein